MPRTKNNDIIILLVNMHTNTPFIDESWELLCLPPNFLFYLPFFRKCDNLILEKGMIMKIIEFLIMLLILGITGLVCFFLCFLVAHKSELWNVVEEKEEGEEDDRE